MSNAKNVEAYGQLVRIYTGSGAQYGAGSQNLREENLLQLLIRSEGVIKGVSDAKTSFENATNGREVVAKKINKLASRVLAELKSSGAMSQTIDDARTMVRKIKGRLASGHAPQPMATAGQSTDATTTPSSASSHSRINGTDYASLAYHFEKLLQTISSEPLYQPLEPELQVAGLQNALVLLRNGNTAVATAIGALMKARRDRNALLYTDPGSMYNTAQALKQRAKAAFGYDSEAAYDVNHIRLTKPTK